jgi:hypothetical protein
MYGENGSKTDESWETRVGEFNWQFQDNVDRGVFKRLTAEPVRPLGPTESLHGEGEASDEEGEAKGEGGRWEIAIDQEESEVRSLLWAQMSLGR